jgi:hypothetical protein
MFLQRSIHINTTNAYVEVPISMLLVDSTRMLFPTMAVNFKKSSSSTIPFDELTATMSHVSSRYVSTFDSDTTNKISVLSSFISVSSWLQTDIHFTRSHWVHNNVRSSTALALLSQVNSCMMNLLNEPLFLKMQVQTILYLGTQTLDWSDCSVQRC